MEFRKYSIITGLLGGLFLILSFFLAGSVFGDSRDFGAQEIFGYSGMLIACVVVFMGAKRFRDRFHPTEFSFGRGFRFSLLAVVIMSLLYALGWEFYTSVQEVHVMDAYFQQQIDNIGQLNLSEEEKAIQISSMKDFQELYTTSTLFRIGMSMTEFFPIGLFTSLLIAAILRIKK